MIRVCVLIVVRLIRLRLGFPFTIVVMEVAIAWSLVRIRQFTESTTGTALISDRSSMVAVIRVGYSPVSFIVVILAHSVICLQPIQFRVL